MWTNTRLYGDPGPCPVDDAPHTTCTSADTPIVIAQLPMRDQSALSQLAHAQNAGQGLTPGQVSTATYRRVPPRKAAK